MYFNQSQLVAIASLVSSYLKFPVNAIVPQLKLKVPTFIEVERVGFTKNASNTPYLVYGVGDRRCCTNALAPLVFGVCAVAAQNKRWHNASNPHC